MNSRRMNRLEELGRVDAERADTKKGARNLRQEKSRIVRELKADGGKVKPKRRKAGPAAPTPSQQNRSKLKGMKLVLRTKEGPAKQYNTNKVFTLKKDGGKVKKKKPIRKISFKAMIEAVKEKNRNPMKDQRLDDSIKGKTVRFIEDEKKAKGGKVGGLKKVQPNQKGLKKLPTKVRNKMGYMKKGGRVGMGKALRGGGCVR